jgi:hypothetical protein
MAIRYSHDQVAARMAAVLKAGSPIIAAGAGNGLSAKCAELGGIDLIIIYNSGRYRMDGMPSIAGLMPYGNANDIVLELGERHVLPAVKTTPVLAGVCGTDPTRDMRRFLRQIVETGFSGVINYPTVARFEGSVRQDLESVGLGFARETEMIAMARELDLYTTCYVRREECRQLGAGRGSDPGHDPGCARSESGRDRTGTRRPHCRAGRGGLRPQAYRCAGVRGCVQHGAASGGASNREGGPGSQGPDVAVSDRARAPRR